MKIYDVSNYQAGLDLSTLDSLGGVIIRAGWGDDYSGQDDPEVQNFVNQADALGIPYGFYLFSYATDNGSFEDHINSEIAHMKRFADSYNPTLGCWLDIENDTPYKRNQCGWEDSEHAEELNYYIQKWFEAFPLSGVYCDRSHTQYLDIPADKLWIATLDGTVIEDCVYCQYTSNPLDTNVKGNYTLPEVAPAKDYSLATEDSEPNIEELAQGVLRGEYGNGEDRVAALGDLYDVVQARVEELVAERDAVAAEPNIDELAQAVLRGEFGDGDDRREALGDLYPEVQAKVNELVNGENVEEDNEPSYDTYVVEDGDSLWGIAEKFYGDGARYQEIADANSLDDSNLIYPGGTLIIPLD